MADRACTAGGVAEAVAAAQADDPFRPVSIIVASPAAGVLVRRAIARQRPVANVSATTLQGLAARIAADSLERTGRRPLPTGVRRRAVAAAVGQAAADGIDIGPAGDHPATVRTLDARFRELRRCSAEAMRALRSTDAAATVLAIYDRFRERVAGEWFDDVDVVEEAARHVLSGAAGAAIGRVVIDSIGTACEPERRLLAALDRAGLLVNDPPHEAAPSEVRASNVVVAPEPETEVRLAVREVVRLARAGTSLSDIAIVHPGAPYTRLVTELLDAAGLPWSGRGAASAAETPTGRALLGLLSLGDADLARAPLMAVLAAAPIVDPATGASVPAAQWERISRDAHVIAGATQWDQRLARLAAETDSRATARLAQIVELRAFVAGLATAVEPPAVRTWSSLAAWASGLLRYIGPVAGDELARVLAAIAAVGSLDAVDRGAAVTPAAFLDELTEQLASDVDHRPIGSGVLVGQPAEVAGVSAAAVLVLGMCEGTLPRRRRDDPILSDAVRSRTSGELPTRRDRRAHEHRELAAIVGRSREATLFAPRADQRAQQHRTPSRWLLAWSPPIDGVTPRRSTDVRPIASFSAAVLGDVATTEQEAALHHLSATTARDDQALRAIAPSLGRSAAAMRARHGLALTEWDGVLGDHPALAIDKRVLSPTAVEVWATCPFRHFLRSVLRVDPTATPEDRVGTDPLERGTLVHAVLERLVRWRIAAAAGSSPPSADDQAAMLDRITAEVCDEFESAGRVGRAVPWELERRTLRADLAAVLALDTEDAASSGLRPAHAEASFGLGADDEFGVAEVELADGRIVRFRGQVDRIDVSQDASRVRVIDYKTGRSRNYKRDLEGRRGQPATDPTAGGRRLQLPVYATAIAGAYPDAVVTAEYWFVTDAEKSYPRVGVELDERTRTRFIDVLTEIADAVEAGVFPAVPGADQLDTWENCRYCDFDRVCPSRRGESFDRRRDDASIVRFLGLREVD